LPPIDLIFQSNTITSSVTDYLATLNYECENPLGIAGPIAKDFEIKNIQYFNLQGQLINENAISENTIYIKKIFYKNGNIKTMKLGLFYN
jgi:hypothetical protein